VALRRAFTLACLLVACARARTPADSSMRTLPGSDGQAHELVPPNARLTVIEFFSAHCKCQAAHDARWREIIQDYQPRGVSFTIVDSEVGASVMRDREQALTRGYPRPILIDAGGRFARELGARYATYVLVLDQRGRRLYAGGIDSDMTQLSAGATRYLRDALDDALDGRPVRRDSSEALGCALALE
jgi:hypothetical protein